jgi:hypothetical protein
MKIWYEVTGHPPSLDGTFQLKTIDVFYTAVIFGGSNPDGVTHIEKL